MPHFNSRLVAAHLRDVVVQHRRAIIVLLLLLLGGIFVSQNLPEASRISATLRGADLTWTALALTSNLAVISAAGLSYKVVLRKLGHKHPWLWLANLHLKRHVIATITPMGGAVSVYVFVKSLGSRGVSANDALFAAAIRGVVGYAAFVMILVPVLFLGNPSAMILLGTAILICVLLILVSAVAVVLRQASTPTWLLRRLPDRVSMLVNQARAHQLRVRDLRPLLALAVTHHLLGVATLYLALMAVGFRGGIETALVGYAIGSLVMMLAPVFQGVGFVEVSMTVTLQQLGVPIPVAIAATILFRFADVWFPFLLGILGQVPSNIPTRRLGTRVPALIAGVIGLIVLLSPLGPGRPSTMIAIPESYFPAIAIISAAWLLALSHALWHRRPVAEIVALGAVATLVPILAAQAGGVLGLPMAAMELVALAPIG